MERMNVKQMPLSQVYGGPDDRPPTPRLVQLCHTQTTNQHLASTGSYMYVKFRSDISSSGRGFRATYQEQPGGEYTGDTVYSSFSTP